MTKHDFIAAWKHRLAGLALYGSTSFEKDGPLKRVLLMYEITGEVEKLLAAIYDSLATPTNLSPFAVDMPKTDGYK